MITPDTLVAALRVAQDGARRAMSASRGDNGRMTAAVAAAARLPGATETATAADAGRLRASQGARPPSRSSGD